MLWVNRRSDLFRINAELGVNFDPTRIHWISSCDEEARPKAILVYSDWTPWAVELTLWTKPGGLSRLAIRAAFDYPFNQVGVRRVHAVVRAHDQTTRMLVHRLGFNREGLLEGWFGEVDGVMYSLLREDCKWIKEPQDEITIDPVSA